MKLCPVTILINKTEKPKFLCKTNGKMDFLGARRAITQCRVITVRPIFFKMVLNRAQSLNEKSHEISARKNKK